VTSKKTVMRKRRHVRIRKKVSGNPERPRLCVFRSLNHIYAQIVDDSSGKTLMAASTLEASLKKKKGHKGNVEAAKLTGQIIGKKAAEAGIKKVIFDRGGYLYHGRVEALAAAAREAGLEF
jgi:large subunit ribosomal protein L18